MKNTPPRRKRIRPGFKRYFLTLDDERTQEFKALASKAHLPPDFLSIYVRNQIAEFIPTLASMAGVDRDLVGIIEDSMRADAGHAHVEEMLKYDDIRQMNLFSRE